MKKTAFILILSLIFGCSGYKSTSDIKREFERSITKDEFPASALQVLELYFSDNTDLEYYQESDGKAFSYEAKTSVNDFLYSIEFNQKGELEDVEKLIAFEELSSNQRDTISDYFNESYSSYNITRTQLQYTTDSLTDRQLLEVIENPDLNGINIRIEIEIEAQSTDELGFFEFLFDNEGEIIQKRRIFKRSIDNIW